jgi:hypothetical protein
VLNKNETPEENYKMGRTCEGHFDGLASSDVAADGAVVFTSVQPSLCLWIDGDQALASYPVIHAGNMEMWGHMMK